jgi:hypothetical protein
LSQGTFIGASHEEVALVAKPDIDARLEVVEECNALPYQLDLLDVVELEPKRAGRDRGGERRERRSFFENDCLEARALREEGSGATDDAAADDDEVGALGR